MQKGQLSLEMIVGLIILLVVAGVVISLVLGFVKPETFLRSTKKAKIEEFKTFCKRLCESDILEYCRTYYGMNEGENDWNGNNKKYELIRVGPYQWYTCEDRVYCFLVEPCDLLGENPVKGCKELLCQSFLEKYEGKVEWANEALLQTVQFSKKCNLNKIPITEREREDWYSRYFKVGCGEEGEEGPGPSGSLYLQSCMVNVRSGDLTCNSNCNQIEVFLVTQKGKNPVTDIPIIKDGKLEIKNNPGLKQFDCIENIYITLSCANPSGDVVGVRATCVE